MTIWEHWQMQKEPLRTVLNDQADLSGVIYQVRHALLQTEQNALAELPDDVLRQQAGVLMGCIKGSMGLLEANITAQVWAPQKQEAQRRPFSKFWLAALCLMAVVCLWCVLRGQWMVLTMLLAASLFAAAACLQERRKALIPPQDEVRITLKPDVEKLFSIIDGQMRSLDRCLNDFVYLNEQLRGASDCTDPVAVSRAADLLEALYECDEDSRAAAGEAAGKLLESLGLQAVEYSEETSRLFTALPSKNTTCTLCPAIISVKEQRLLKRGTAVVRMDAA